jgi:hypothetical protein
MKKIIALILTGVILISGLPAMKVSANVQLGVQTFTATEVYYVVGQSIIDGSSIIQPSITVEWTDPITWAEGMNPSDYHTPDYYLIKLVNKTTSKTQELQILKGTEEFVAKKVKLHEHTNLETGSFYEITIQPMHYHQIDVDTRVLAPSSGTPKKVYVITDPLVELQADENEIRVVWDNVGNDQMSYKIVYALGDFTNRTAAELITNKTGEITNVTTATEGVTEFYDPLTKRAKLSYTITQNVYPGQIYSFIVEPTLDYVDGNQITRNRNFQYINTCSTNVGLAVVEDGDYVRLQWQIPPSFKVGSDQAEYELVEAQLVEYSEGLSRNIAIFKNSVAASMEYYKIQKPLKETEYQIKLRYEAVASSSKPPIYANSAKVPYVPEAMKITPTQPYVPQPISQKILDQLKAANTAAGLKLIMEKNYMVPGDYFSNSDILNFISTNRSFTVDKNTNTIKLVFEAFKKRETDTNSPVYGQYTVDANVYYDIYVSNNINDLAGAIPVLKEQKFSQSTENVISDTGGNIIGYKVDLNKYFTADSIGLKAIVPNQIYYIKVVAYKKWGDEVAKSVPTIVTIYYDYDGDISSPPLISTPPLKVVADNTTDTSVQLKWAENWYEIVAKDTTAFPVLAQWTNEIWVDKVTGDLSTTAKTNSEYFDLYNSKISAEQLKVYLKSNWPARYTNFDYIQRRMTLGKDLLGQSDVAYEMLSLKYEDIKSAIEIIQEVNPNYNLNEYIQNMLEDEADAKITLDWKKISPITTTTIPPSVFHTATNLLPNTQYVFLLKPYRMSLENEVLYAHHPAVIVATTDKQYPDVKPDPIVPSLYCTGVTETNATLTWRYNLDFEYELKFGLIEDISKAKDIKVQLPTNHQDPKYPSNGAYFDKLVGDLFPDTDYYFWIRAKNPVTGKFSAYSSALLVTTEDINSPWPATGLGLAAFNSIQPFGYTVAQGDTFLAVEWLLNPNDTQGSGNKDNKVVTSYEYILEVATNEKFIDPQYIQLTDGTNDILPSNVEKLAKNLLMINKLTPNRRYYFRVKTKVIVQGSEVGQYIEKESVYSPVVILLTKTNNDEYDSNVADNMIVLQNEYYETVYNKDTKELKYRFRFDGNDQNGTFDNYLVERLITDLKRNNTYVYSLNMKEFEKFPIIKRTVELPYRLWKAMMDNKIDLAIKANNSTLLIPANALTTQVNAQVNNLGQKPTVRISIEDKSVSYMNEKKPSELVSASVPQQYSIKLLTEIGNKEVLYTDKEVTIRLANNNRYSIYQTPTSTMFYNPKTLSWNAKPMTYDKTANEMIVKTYSLGAYNTFSNAKTTAVTPHWSNKFREILVSNLNIVSMNVSKPENKITKQDFLKIIYGSISDQGIIDISSKLTQSQVDKLVKGKVAVNNKALTTGITREEAFYTIIQALNKVEGKTYTPKASTLKALPTNISSTYKKNIAIAYELGIVSKINEIRPKDTLTYAEMYKIVGMLLEYK